MPAILVRNNLSKDDLKLFLINDLGYPQDAFEVRWTIKSHTGVMVSGSMLPAIRLKTGEYYAPWFSDVQNGNYSIIWSVQSESGLPFQEFVDQLFVVDPASYQCCPGPICKDGVPLPGRKTYLTGTQLGRGDLPLFLKNGDGVIIDAFAVFWTIFNQKDCPVSPRTAADHASIGEYFASWYIYVPFGDYYVLWEYMQDSSSPLQSVRMGFSILNPSALVSACTNLIHMSSCGPSMIRFKHEGDCSCCDPCPKRDRDEDNDRD